MLDDNKVAVDNNSQLALTIASCGGTISQICLATPMVKMAISLSQGNKIGILKRDYKSINNVLVSN
jgi:hypothetical protein